MNIGDRIRDAVRAVANGDKRAARGGIIGKRDGVGLPFDEGIADFVALAFISAEEEEFIFKNGAAHGGPELLQAPWCLWRTHRVEEVARIEDRIAVKAIGGPVETVGARFHRHVDDGPGLPAVFRGGILLHVKLLNRVNRQDRRRVSCDARAVDDALAGEGFAVKDAIHNVCIVFGAKAVGAGGGKSASRITDHTRPELQKVFVVASIQGEIVDFFIAQRAAKRGGRGVKKRYLLGDHDCFRGISWLQQDVHANVRRHFQLNVLALIGLEALGCRAHLVHPRKQIGRDKFSRLVRDQRAREVSLHVCDADLCADDHGVRFVMDTAQNSRGIGLRMSWETS